MKYKRITFYFLIYMMIFTFPMQALSQIMDNRGEKVYHHYVVSCVKGSIIDIDSTYDAFQDKRAVAVLSFYKRQITKLMSTPIGFSEEMMSALTSLKPEGLLSNLIADVIRREGSKVIGEPCDMGLINKGGIRAILPKGKIMLGTIYEIMPFENSISVLKLKGKQLNKLLSEIAHAGGEGISGVKMVITRDRKLLRATVSGKNIDENKIYTLATINYLSEGNDGMNILGSKDIKRLNRGDLILRDVFINYIKAQTAKGKLISSRIENRIVVGE